MSAAASGMRARLEALDLVANNLANAGTAGYKLDREFYGLYAAPDAGGGQVQPVLERNWTDFSSGTLTPTGNPLDVAISGRGFFVADGPGGPLYTRNGALRITGGVLSTADGHPLRGADGNRIVLDATRAVEITGEARVRQGGVEAGRVAVVEFANPASLSKAGRTYFMSTETPSPARVVELHQGKLEASNVAVPEAAVRMVGILRQFEMLQRAASLGGEMGRRSVEEVARVNP